MYFRSAFFFFSHDKRPEVQQQHPEWKVGQVAQELGRFWKALGEEERAVYERKALEDKERYAEVLSLIYVLPCRHQMKNGHFLFISI